MPASEPAAWGRMEEGFDASHAPARKKAALDYALEGEITNPHLRAFAATPLCDALRHDVRFDYWRRYSRCKKELIESWAALQQLRRCVQRLSPDKHETGKGLTFVELCSGRGCLSMLLAHTFPDSNIHMCDSDGRMKLPHLSHPSMRNVSFHLEDIFHDDAARTVRNAVDSAHLDGGYCLVVGVHYAEIYLAERCSCGGNAVQTRSCCARVVCRDDAGRKRSGFTSWTWRGRCGWTGTGFGARCSTGFWRRATRIIWT